MGIDELFKKNPNVLGIITVTDGIIRLESDDSKIDEKSLMLFLHEVLIQHLEKQ